MRNLLHFLARYINLILFILFEGAALYLIVTRNNYHNSRFVNSVNGISAAVEKKFTDTRNYIRLRKINSDLAIENALLRNRLERFTLYGDSAVISAADTSGKIQYEYITSSIAGNSVNRQRNFLTLDKGTKDSITVDMAVIGPDGVAGIIIGCSENYSVAMSLLNTDFRLSSRLRSSGYFGSLAWDGRDYRYAVLNEIPQHVTINEGDTVETTSYSAIFPEGIMVGTVSEYEKSGSDFYRIRVALSTNFRKLSNVTIIRNVSRDEQINLEGQFQ